MSKLWFFMILYAYLNYFQFQSMLKCLYAPCRMNSFRILYTYHPFWIDYGFLCHFLRYWKAKNLFMPLACANLHSFYQNSLILSPNLLVKKISLLSFRVKHNFNGSFLTSFNSILQISPKGTSRKFGFKDLLEYAKTFGDSSSCLSVHTILT